MSVIHKRMIDLSPGKKKPELHDDVKYLLEFIDYPTTWEHDGKVIKLSKATKKQLWLRFIDIMPIHMEKVRAIRAQLSHDNQMEHN